MSDAVEGVVLPPARPVVRALLVPVHGPVLLLVAEADIEVICDLLGGAHQVQGHAPPTRTWQALVDDDARARNLDANLRASGLARARGWPSRANLYGPALFVGVTRAGDGGEAVCDVPDSLLAAAGGLGWEFATPGEVNARLGHLGGLVAGLERPPGLAGDRHRGRPATFPPPWQQ